MITECDCSQITELHANLTVSLMVCSCLTLSLPSCLGHSLRLSGRMAFPITMEQVPEWTDSHPSSEKKYSLISSLQDSPPKFPFLLQGRPLSRNDWMDDFYYLRGNIPSKWVGGYFQEDNDFITFYSNTCKTDKDTDPSEPFVTQLPNWRKNNSFSV